MIRPHSAFAISLAVSISLLGGCSVTPPAAPTMAVAPRMLALTPCRVPGVAEEVRCGTYEVPENRERATGRMIPLQVVVLPARAERPAKEPVFFITGGPGQPATKTADRLSVSWERQNHDVVLVDARGTGEGHRLDCPLRGSDDDLQGYVEPMFDDLAMFRACRQELEKIADLTQYTSLAAARDLDDVRQALGHDRILLRGVSYGTRVALTYIRLYGEHVKGAMLTSIAHVDHRNPLHHAAGAQRAFDLLVADCEAEAPCREKYPRLREDLAEILRTLREQPARARIAHPVSKAPAEVLLSEATFTATLHSMLHSVPFSRRIPALLQQAKTGDFSAFAEAAVHARRGFVPQFRLGAGMSVICSEDVPRIGREELERETAGTFMGRHRAESQISACAEWPKATLPPDYYRPFRSDVPVVLVSGSHDPITPPRWGESVKPFFRHSIHLVVPGGHIPMNDCLAGIGTRLFQTGTIEGLDTSCVAALRNPPFTAGAPKP